MLKTNVPKNKMAAELKKMREVLRVGKIRIQKQQWKLEVLEERIRVHQAKVKALRIPKPAKP